MNPITPELIKDYIEQESNVQDISVKSRKKEIVFMRYVYYQLTYDFCRETTQQRVSDVVNQRDHASTIHGRKTFQSLKNQKVFEYALSIYETAYREFSKYDVNKKIETLLLDLEKQRQKLINQIEVTDAQVVY